MLLFSVGPSNWKQNWHHGFHRLRKPGLWNLSAESSVSSGISEAETFRFAESSEGK